MKKDIIRVIKKIKQLGLTYEEFARIYYGSPVIGNNNEVYLVRHATTSFNSSKERIRSVIDIPLDEKGLIIANQTGITLKKTPIACIYSSELTRSKQTAQAIYLNGGKQIELLSGLNAWDLGSLGGELSDKNEDQTQKLVDNPDTLPPDSNESYNIFKTRTIAAYEQAIKFNGTIAIVSHYSNCRAILEYLGKKEIEMKPGEVIKIG